MKRSMRAPRPGQAWPLFSLTLTALIATASAAAPVLPTGGKVVAGSATIAAPKGGALTIDQTSSRAIIDWSSFSIGAAGAVKFDNGSGATLNRVTGAGGSALDGLLSGTGSIYLINPNGVIVGQHGVVNVGGTFTASTLDVADSQFLAGGNMTFAGTSNAAVVNYGRIGALGGDVALIAATVDNAGSISAVNGTAGLAAGYRVLLRDKALNDGKFAVLLGGSKTSVTNSGLIQAANAELRANGGNVYALAGNTGGIISATGVKAGQGKVWLIADGGILDLAGSISAQGAKGSAGAIETSGETVNLGNAAIDARGGTWLIDPYDLTVNSVAAAAIDKSLAADTSVTLRTTATIATGPGVKNPSGNGDIFVDAPISWTTAATLTLSAYRNIDINSAISLGDGTFTLTANNAATGVGAIAVNAPITISGAGAVNINAAAPVVSTSSGSVPNLQLTFANGASVNYGDTDNGGMLSINGQSYLLLYSLADFTVSNFQAGNTALATGINAAGTTYTSPFTAVFPGDVFEGLGNAIAGLTISPSHAAGALFYFVESQGVARDLVLSGGKMSDTASGDAADGFFATSNNGLIVNISVSGQVDGGTTKAVGDVVGDNTGVMIGVSASGNVTSNGANVGGLVGTNEGTIEGSSASGPVNAPNASGGDTIGGLVAENSGAIEYSNAEGTVTGNLAETGVSTVSNGGLVGDNTGSITNSWATGAVSGRGLLGGLVGYSSSGSISQSFATGAVAGAMGDGVGGLVGENDGSITTSYATGAVTGGASAGGLVGSMNGGSIAQSFATGEVYSSVGGYLGGLIGGLNSASVTNSFSTGAVIGGLGRGYAAGLIGFDAGTVSDAYATGWVSAPGMTTGGLVVIGVPVTDGYYSASTTGQLMGAQSDGSVGVSTKVLQSALPAGFSSSVWGIIPGTSFPYLLAFYAPGTTPQIISGAARQISTSGALGSVIAGQTVDAVVNGSDLIATTTTGANGYYYLMLNPGTLGATNTLTTFLASGTDKANAVAMDAGAGNIAGLALLQNTLSVQTADTTLSTTESDLALGLGAATPSSEMIFAAPGGNLALSSGASLQIASTGASFDLDRSLNLGDAFFKLTASGTVDQTAGMLTANAVQGSSVGGADFTETGNQIAQLTGWADPTGTLTLADAGALSVAGEVTAATGIGLTTTTGALSLSRGLISTDGGVTLDSAGAVTEAAGLATISAKGELTVTSVGGAKMQAANTVGSLSLANTGGGTVSYKETGELTVASASNGTSGALTIVNTGGAIEITGQITGGTVTLTSAGAITKIGAGAITAATLTGSADGAVSLGGANQIATLSKFTDTAGSFTLNDAEALKQSGTLNAGSQTVSLTTTAGDIAVDGTIEAGVLTLDSKAGALTESGAIGAIKVGTLNATAATGITLTGTHNDITTIGINSPGSGPDKITR